MKTSYFTLLVTGFLLLSLLWTACIDSTEKDSTLESFIARGDSISKATADTLKATLLQAIREKGLPGAVAFCHEKALSITQLYAEQKVSISRVAERFRNPNSQLDSLDAAQWNRYQSLKTRGDSLASTVVETNDAFVYYQPIILQPICASCHGNPATIPTDLLTTIDSLYPQDKARGFSPGDLRGMWKIAFRK
jgi:hypothetical protein